MPTSTRTRGPRGMISVDVESTATEIMLNRLNLALSPHMLAGWMKTTVDPYIKKRIKERFIDEGDEVSGDWLPLQPSTRIIRARAGYGADHPINIRTGMLEQFITQAPPRINPHSLGATYTYPGKPPTGETLTKLKTAQFGKGREGRGRRASVHTPPRPVLGLGERDAEFLIMSLGMHIAAPGVPG